jgi:hypothetical protein
MACTCKKHTLQNITSKIAVVTYNRCSDNAFIDEQYIQPGATVNLYYVNDTYYTAYGNALVTVAIENWPAGCDITPTPTPSVTMTVTPTSSTGAPTPTPTSSETPTPTPTLTQTPTVTPTVTPTTGVTTTPTPTLTSTPTLTPSSTVAGPPALIFIESSDDAVNPAASPNTDILAYMISTGATTWFGFQVSGIPNFGDANQVADFLLWMDWPGFVNGTTNNTNGTLTANIPQVSGGLDSYGNVIDAFTFITTEVPAGSVTGSIYYIVLAPLTQTNSQIYSQIAIDYNNSPQSMISYNTESSLRSTNIVYSGPNWENTTYRVYTQSPNNGFTNGSPGVTDSTNNYFKGSTLI